MGGDENTGKK